MITIEINVNIGLTAAAERALLAFRAFGGSPKEEQRETKADADNSGHGQLIISRGALNTVRLTPEQLPEETAPEADAPEADAPEADAPEAPAAPVAEEAPAEEAAGIPDDQLKAAMDLRLMELCGPDWQTSKDPEVRGGVKMATKAFKEIAGHLGAEKPSALPQEKRQQFIDFLRDVKNDPGTYRITWQPF